MNCITKSLSKKLLYPHISRRFVTTKKKIPDHLEETVLPVFEYPKAKNSDRRVYVWGLAETGALGLQVAKTSSSRHKWNDLEYVRHPTRHPFAERFDVTHVTTGYGFTAFAVKSPSRVKVFGTGLNTDSQIGYHAPRSGHPLELLLNPAPILLPIKEPATTQVTALSAGRAHLMILTDEGVFTMGNNAYGQCGRRVNPDENYQGSHVIHHIKNFGKEKIIDIVCGQDHSLFLTQSGKVYACGWGADGQTGQGHFFSNDRPALVTGDITSEKIVKLASTVDCVLALNDKGDVFGWGNTEYGQIPYVTDLQQVNKPHALTFFKGLGKIVDISAGGSFCLAVNDQGDVFVWGYGLLGLGPQVQHSPNPTLIPPALFGRNEFNPNSRVVRTACGISHSAAMTDSGDLFVWGRNKHSCLGLGHDNDQHFPLKASVGAHVLYACCGVDHTVAFCKPFV